MKLDKFSRPIFSEQDLFDLIYQGINLDNYSSKIYTEDLSNFISNSNLNFQTADSTSLSLEEFDKLNQKNWYMGEYYKNMDIAHWLKERCTSPEELDRVTQELILFSQYNMIDILKYLKFLVDIMRYNNIVWGVGRGSSVASYCLFLIGVHKIDSIKYNLDYKEFLR